MVILLFFNLKRTNTLLSVWSGILYALRRKYMIVKLFNPLSHHQGLNNLKLKTKWGIIYMGYILSSPKFVKVMERGAVTHLPGAEIINLTLNYPII
jgi:hypothetical protein